MVSKSAGKNNIPQPLITKNTDVSVSPKNADRLSSEVDNGIVPNPLKRSKTTFLTPSSIKKVVRMFLNAPLKSLTGLLYLQSGIAAALKSNPISQSDSSDLVLSRLEENQISNFNSSISTNPEISRDLSIPNLVGFNQCPRPVESSNPLKECFSILRTALEINYDIITNVADLNDVKIWFFAEEHSVEIQQLLQSAYINMIGDAEDLVLFEGTDREEQFSCESVCRFRTGQQVHMGEDNACVQSRGLQPIGIPNKFKCGGWESAEHRNKEHASKWRDWGLGKEFVEKDIENLRTEIYQRSISDLPLLSTNPRLVHRNLIKLLNGINSSSLNDVVKTQLPEISGEIEKQIQSLQKSITSLRHAAKKNFVLAQTQFLQTLHEMENTVLFIRTKVVEKANSLIKEMEPQIEQKKLLRNRFGMIQTLESLRNRKGKIFVIAGRFHLIATDCDPYEISSKNWSYELREYLKTVAHAILVPKAHIAVEKVCSD